jgi:exonuclease SbcD
VRILHTADWHVGKKLGRIDRSSETESVLDELVGVARASEVDLVIVAGDLFDRALPPFLSLRLVLETLVRLANTGARVVAVPGNHDSADLFEVLGPHLAHSGVTLVHKPMAAAAGGVVQVPSRDGHETAQVACFPFLHEAHVVDFMDTQDEMHKSYADRVRDICRHYADAMQQTSDRNTVDLLVAHFMIHGAIPSGSERGLHIGEAYMARAEALPAGVHYAALGHIHKSQEAPGSGGHGRYAGSLMQLDFGESDQDKSVVLVEVSADGKRSIEEVPITSGRRLQRIEATLDDLRGQADDLQGAILDVGVLTDGPSPGLADEVREFLPDALYVRAIYERDEERGERPEGMTLTELYSAYFQERHQTLPDDDLVMALTELVDEVGVSL